MMNNGNYEEDFINSRVSNNPEAIEYVLREIAEVHSSDRGWIVDEPVITPNADGKTVTVKVHLTKVREEETKRGR